MKLLRRNNEIRELTSHKVNGLNDSLTIQVRDEPGEGNANHYYHISGFSLKGNRSINEGDSGIAGIPIVFQNGPILESGFNGVSNESLLAIVEDRLLGFQSGQFACRENAVALTKLQEAMMWLQKRTMDRMRRGVEGTHSK